jgi:hypothetical protein
MNVIKCLVYINELFGESFDQYYNQLTNNQISLMKVYKIHKIF